MISRTFMIRVGKRFRRSYRLRSTFCGVGRIWQTRQPGADEIDRFDQAARGAVTARPGLGHLDGSVGGFHAAVVEPGAESIKDASPVSFMVSVSLSRTIKMNNWSKYRSYDHNQAT